MELSENGYSLLTTGYLDTVSTVTTGYLDTVSTVTTGYLDTVFYSYYRLLRYCYYR